MAVSPKRVYWDACAWIALVQKEKIRDTAGNVIEDRETLCKSIISAASAKKIEIVTSTLSLVEVCKNPGVATKGEDLIASFFEHDFILLANFDRSVGERARQLMMVGYSKLKPPDSAHIATAALVNVDELHTFDKKLLDLDGQIDRKDGKKLKICRPGDTAAAVPLLEAPQDSGSDTEGGADEDIDLALELGDEQPTSKESEDEVDDEEDGAGGAADDANRKVQASRPRE